MSQEHRHVHQRGEGRETGGQKESRTTDPVEAEADARVRLPSIMLEKRPGAMRQAF